MMAYLLASTKRRRRNILLSVDYHDCIIFFKDILGTDVQDHVRVWDNVSKMNDSNFIFVFTDEILANRKNINLIHDALKCVDHNGFLAFSTFKQTNVSKVFSKKYSNNTKKYIYTTTPFPLQGYMITPKVAKLLLETFENTITDLHQLEKFVLDTFQRNLIRPMCIKYGILDKATHTKFRRRRTVFTRL